MSSLESAERGEAFKQEIADSFLNVPKINNGADTADALYKFLKKPENKPLRNERVETWGKKFADDLGLDYEDETDFKAFEESTGNAQGLLVDRFKEYAELESNMNETRNSLMSTPFYTDYGADKHFDKLFADQEKARAGAETFAFDKLIFEQKNTLEKLHQGARDIDGVSAGIPPEFFEDKADQIFASANERFFKNIEAGDPDYSDALGLAEAAAKNIESEKNKHETAQKVLSESSQIERSVDHLLSDEKNLLELRQNPRKILRLLADRHKIEFDENFISEGVVDGLLQSYVEDLENRYSEKLEDNKATVETTHAELVQAATQMSFVSRADYENFIREGMQERFPDGEDYMPDTEWDRIKATNMRAAEQAWEKKLETGETAAWGILDQGLASLEYQHFPNETAFSEYFKKLGQQVANQQLLPNEAWDDRLGSAFREKAVVARERYLEKRTKQVQSRLDKALEQAEAQKFSSKADLIKFFKGHTEALNSKKLIPDEHWNQAIAPNLKAQVETIWNNRNTEKKDDFTRVKEAMQTVSLNHEGKPKSTEDFYRIAKKNLPKNIQGKLTDQEWDSHMKAYFYPRVKDQLRQNEQTVQNTMRSAALPNPAEFESRGAFEKASKVQFASQHGNVLGLIPNDRYDVLRNRYLVQRAKEQWRQHESAETSTLDQARNALSDKNLIKTVHHFAKNKGIKNPSTEAIYASSSNALAVQFGLTPDQLKTLDPEIKAYSAQAKSLHQLKTQKGKEVIQNYQVPADFDFAPEELSSSKAFYDVLVSLNGYMQFEDSDDWYLVEDMALSHIDSLRQEAIKNSQKNAALTDKLKSEDESAELNLEVESEKLKNNQANTEKKHPVEQTDWMSRYGIPCEAVSQKGVERFNSLLTLPEFSFGNIPQSDLRTVLPALVNMAGGMIDRSWKNFRLTLRDALREEDITSPNDRLFTIMKTFALGYPLKPNDFDFVGGVDNTFNNLVKRIKGPDGEKFSSIKNLYRHYAEVLPEDFPDDEEITEETLEALESVLEEIEDVESEVLETEDPETLDENPVEALPTPEPAEEPEMEEELEAEEENTPTEPELPPENIIEPEIDEVELQTKEEEEVQAELAIETETEVVSESGMDIGAELPAEITSEDQDQIGGDLAEEEIDTNLLDEETLESEEALEEAPPDLAEVYQDYLEEGAVVLTEVDQILRTPNALETEEAAEIEEELEAIVSGIEEKEERPEEQKSPIDEAAEVVPEKIHKFLLKLSARGLMSDEAWAWVLDRSTEFKADSTGPTMTLGGALDLVQVILQSQFLGKNLKFEVQLDLSLQKKGVIKAEKFIEQFLDQIQAVDGLQAVVVNGHRDSQLRGYFITRQDKRTFKLACQLGPAVRREIRYN